MKKEIDDFEPNLTLGDLILLFLRSYDDKVYINVIPAKANFDLIQSLTGIRIIDSKLVPFWEYRIFRFEEEYFPVSGWSLTVYLEDPNV